MLARFCMQTFSCIDHVDDWLSVSFILLEDFFFFEKVIQLYHSNPSI